jgi:phosphoserine phosphatase
MADPMTPATQGPVSELVATLVADPARPEVTDALVARLAQGPSSVIHHEGRFDVLDPGVAADLAIRAGVTVPEARGALESALSAAGAPVDVIVQPAATRRKRLFLADMDSTMIGQECIDELADFVGLKEKVSGITERAMRGELAFEPALRERVALLAGLGADVVERILAERITLTPGGAALVRTMKAHAGYAALVSGGFTLFTGPVAARIGFDEHRSNTLLVENGRLVGRVAEPIVGREAKLAALVELRARFGLAPSQTLAVGDGANDLAMLQEAGLGVAFRAKPAVAAAAHARVDHADLTALLYAQGYRRAEFRTEP